MSNKIYKYLFYSTIIIIALYLALYNGWLYWDTDISKQYAKKEKDLEILKLNLLKGKWMGSLFQDSIISIKSIDTSKREIVISPSDFEDIVNLRPIDTLNSKIRYIRVASNEDSIELTYDGRVTKFIHHETKVENVYDTCLFWNLLYGAFIFFNKYQVNIPNVKKRLPGDKT